MENPIPDMTDIDFMIASIYVAHIKNGGTIETGYDDRIGYWHPDCISPWEQVLYKNPLL